MFFFNNKKHKREFTETLLKKRRSKNKSSYKNG